MKYFKKTSFVVLLILLVTSLLIPFSVNADEPSYPTSINGYPIIFVQTPENTFGLSSSEVVLTLLDKSAKTAEDSVAKLNLAEYLKNSPLPKGWSIEVYGGTGASKEEFEKAHQINEEAFYRFKQENKEWFKKSGPILYDSTSSGPTATLVGSPTYAAFKNDDTNSQVITGQRARWYAPKVGTTQSDASYFLNNGMTNVGNYFLQSGQLYQNGTGYNIWADTTTNNSPRPFNVAYYVNHKYEFAIVYSAGVWSMWCEDCTSGVFDRYLENNATGTKLINDVNTSVFFENWNTNANWYTGFTNPLYAFYARDYWVQWKGWNGGKIIIVNSAHQVVPNNGIITGTLVNYGTAYWQLSKILLRQ